MKITVLHHETAANSRMFYLVNHLSGAWKSGRHSVTHVAGVNRGMPDADILVLHVDLTRVPPNYVDATQQYPVAINCKVTDISKPVFSRILLGRGDDYAGKVIVKTKANFGGLPELMAKRLSECKEQRQGERKHWGHVEWLARYPIFESIEAVPEVVWRNPNLVVEKFLPERDRDGNFHVREWIFLGDRNIHYRNISSKPVIKGRNVERREYMSADDIPGELKAIRRALKMDYGKFDYVSIGGEVVLFDVNKTPGAPCDLSARPGAINRIREFSRGLECYL